MTSVTSEIYRFRFTPVVPMDRARDLVARAILMSQEIHGEARVRLDCGYFADDRTRSLVVDARTKAGQSVAVFFTQLLLNEFGLSAFDVERVPKDDGFPPYSLPSDSTISIADSRPAALTFARASATK